MERAPKKSRTPKDATPQHGDPRFFAAKDASGLLSINPRLIDTFLRWECGRTLLGMNLFPNMQEISESMACLAAVTSVWVPIMRSGRPSASRSMTSPRERIHFQLPSLQRTRCSLT
jgi:hypothetical protein